MNHTEIKLETILYSIIEELSKEDAPIVFKGALALKDLLYINNPDLDIERRTVDIDANWTDTYDKDKIVDTIEKAVKKVNSSYSIKLVREPDTNKSMGFKIMDDKGITISKLDMDIKNNPFYVICTINDVDVKYSNFNKMMADKLLSISGTHIFRRVKDILDIYLIILDNKIRYKDIQEVLKYEDKKLGNFEVMLNNRNLLKESYSKLEGVNNKPDFEIVWDSVLSYLKDEKIIDNNKKGSV